MVTNGTKQGHSALLARHGGAPWGLCPAAYNAPVIHNAERLYLAREKFTQVARRCVHLVDNLDGNLVGAAKGGRMIS